ncbi:hypothetical protein RV12_GL002675 [Enterococcus quebecensis]|nr:hypothetical protein RV12_GL002675 [Enterococcus quebecensis]
MLQYLEGIAVASAQYLIITCGKEAINSLKQRKISCKK